MTVHETQRCDVAPHFAPRSDHERIGVRVTIRGASARQVPVNPFYATLQATDGERFEATLAGCEPGLPARRVVKDETVSGWLSFDVPESKAIGLTLGYSPVVIGAGVEAVRFTLGR